MLMTFSACSKQSEEADKFQHFLNTRQKNAKFTIEKEQDQKLPFQYLLVTKQML